MQTVVWVGGRIYRGSFRRKDGKGRACSSRLRSSVVERWWESKRRIENGPGEEEKERLFEKGWWLLERPQGGYNAGVTLATLHPPFSLSPSRTLFQLLSPPHNFVIPSLFLLAYLISLFIQFYNCSSSFFFCLLAFVNISTQRDSTIEIYVFIFVLFFIFLSFSFYPILRK